MAEKQKESTDKKQVGSKKKKLREFFKKIPMKKILIGILSFAILWFVIGFIVNAFRSSPKLNFFLLKNSVLASMLVVIVFVGIIILLIGENYKKCIKWISVNEKYKITLIASSIFYFCIFALLIIFTVLLNHQLSNDWTLIFLAAIPLLIYLALIGFEKFDKFSIKFKDFTLEASKNSLSSIQDTLILDNIDFKKASLEKLKELITERKILGETINTLLVDLDNEIRFNALREYVYEIKKSFPLKFIVFINNQKKYLGFLTIDKYIDKVPKSNLETIFEELDRNKLKEIFVLFSERFRNERRESNSDWKPKFEDWINIFDRLKGFFRVNTSQGFNENGYINALRINISNLEEFGVNHSSIKNLSLLQTFNKLVESDIEGLPVVDNENKYLGIVFKVKVMQSIIYNLVKKA